MTSTQYRSNSQDIAKGFAIFVVVLVHVWWGLLSVGVFVQAHPLNFIDKASVLFGMPLFFVLAGFNAYSSIQRSTTRDFIVKRAKNIIPIYVVWSVVQSVLHYFKHESGASGTSSDILHNLLIMWYQPIDQFWFLYALLVYHILTALLHKRPRVLLAVAAMAYLSNQFMPLFLREMSCCGIFYVLGYLAGGKGLPSEKEIPKYALPLLGALYVTSALFVNVYWLDLLGSPMFTPILCSTCFFILLSYKLRDTRAGHIIAVAGRASLAIYVMHVLFFSAARMILFKLGVMNGYAHLVMETIVGLFGPLLIYTELKRRNWLRYAFLG